jgi:hypothetical protein
VLPDTIDIDARLTATQAAAYVRMYRPCSVQAIVNWRNRGHLEQGADGKYRLLDVAKAEYATRRKARR